MVKPATRSTGKLFMKAPYLLVILIGCFAALSACDQEARMSERGFRLPPGDAQAGRETFINMRCHQCHTIVGEELPVIPALDPPYVELGGRVAKVKTYGELVTAITTSSHSDKICLVSSRCPK